MLPILPLSTDALTDALDEHLVLETDATGKRKVNGELAATRLGQSASERWANERFRQVMYLALEFRSEWPDRSLLTSGDVAGIKVAVDDALFYATQNNHVGDIYDMNPTVWAIWLVQRAHTLKVGGWTVETPEAQQRLSFASLYTFLQQQHGRRNKYELSLRDPTTNKLLHRYSLPFKAMRIPPAPDNLFKYRKGAKRLSDWIVAGSSEGQQATGLAAGIVAMEPAQVVAPPPGLAQREARANAAWGRVRAAAQRRSQLRSVVGDSEDAESTRRVVHGVVRAAQESDLDNEMERELERDMEGGDGAGPSNDGSMPLEDIERVLMEDSDGEGGDGGRGGGAGEGTDGGGEELAEYELERLANIQRNQEILRALGLFKDPPPPPPPRQPRQPRASDGPRRESSRLQGQPRPSYNEE